MVELLLTINNIHIYVCVKTHESNDPKYYIINAMQLVCPYQLSIDDHVNYIEYHN